MSVINRLILHTMPRAYMIALVSQGRLIELQVTRRDRPPLVEAIFLGRMERIMPDLDAAFVDIGTGRAGFLRAEDLAGDEGWPAPGTPLLVQVRSDSDSEKGPRLSMNVAVTGRYLVYHPMGAGLGFSRRIDSDAERGRLRGLVEGLLDGGVVLRTAATGAPAERLQHDAASLLERWERIRREALSADLPANLSARIPAERDVVAKALRDYGNTLEDVFIEDRMQARALQDEMDRRREKIRARWHNAPMPVFDIDDVTGQIDTALAPRIALASGVELLFEPGETLCAIDVDSATAGGRQGHAPRGALEVNLEAVPAIAHQLRLRNIAGNVVIDFVTMRSAADRDKVQASLAAALADDSVPVQAYGFTRLGLFELTRARRGPTLAAELEALEKSDD